jgi:hypothetical protein
LNSVEQCRLKTMSRNWGIFLDCISTLTFFGIHMIAREIILKKEII